jgi:hypothetical protein
MRQQDIDAVFENISKMRKGPLLIGADKPTQFLCG